MLQDLHLFLTENGFQPADQIKDIGSTVSGLFYAHRMHNGRHEYVSVCSYDGKFCEAIYETYLAPKNSKAPKGKPAQAELERNGYAAKERVLLRSPDEIKARVLAPSIEQEKELRLKAAATVIQQAAQTQRIR